MAVAFLNTGARIGNCSIKVGKGVKEIKEVGFDTAILADTNFLNFLRFYYECKNSDIKPIIGVVFSYKKVKYLLIAKNFQGFKAISKMDSLKVLEKDPNVIRVLVGFQDPKKLKGVEVDFVGVEKFPSPTKTILETFSKKHNIPLIPVSFPTHLKGEEFTAMAMKAVAEGMLLEDVQNKGLINPDNHLLTLEDMKNSFSEDMLSDLEKISSMCEDDYSFGHPIAPNYKFLKNLIKKLQEQNPKIPNDLSEDRVFAYVARLGLKERDLWHKKEYRDRLEHEISIIQKMGFSGYMLIVQDIIQTAHELNVPTGPGRGSAAGSLVAYAMKITDLDPLPYGLLFERFLNPERVTMPDIDMDFCQAGRQKVLDKVAEKYGAENIAQIVTFGTFGARGGIRDAARIVGLNLQVADRLSKLIPETPGISLEEGYKQSKKDIDKMIASNPLVKKTLTYTKKLEGHIRHLGVHAAGVVLTNEPVYTKCPIINVNGTQVVSLDGKYLEDVDLIKFDFLGLKTLTFIDKALNLIKKNYGVEIEFNSYNMNDKKTFEMISTGNTDGIFQIESDGMKQLCKDIQPKRFEDLVALIALYRPGPMDSGMLDDFVKRASGEKKVEYFSPEFEPYLKPILEPTYGVIVYQEQVMQIVQSIGGFSLGEADVIRRAMGKKDIKYMKEKAEQFANGAVAKGLPRKKAVELFQLIEKFAGYGFNKSHSAAYAMIGYQTAYIKAHYPKEFYTALLSIENSEKNFDKVAKYIASASKFNITISNPDINTSGFDFELKGNTIYYGLSAIKGVGSGAEVVINNRGEGYKNFEDFVNKTIINPKKIEVEVKGKKVLKAQKLNKRVFEGLVIAGALDSFGYSRKALLDNATAILKVKKIEDLKKIDLSAPEFAFNELVKEEIKKVGFVITDPFKVHEKTLNELDIPLLSDLKEGKNDIVILPIDITIRTAKKTGNKFAIIKVVYKGDTIEVLAFKNAFVEAETMKVGKPYILEVSFNKGTVFLNKVKEYSEGMLLSTFSVSQK